ncbi:hypothetical protein TREMEDRAFT_62122 [Tremella mesenterica DSM 1558]|uniref:uncharacterized protein n=1 Tax=Tremella mesenterica (strain ATCC 24925 / CBS 8224 / DSM 1558 / NBRC 9311 / NRRL Y-6157 / RJB 2259-6 / UBC 559-6) TaxID=578456 RepID=UPI0003F49D2A|nr:uncharacterized protein TREMEDRAFT_62122 [Tremella mesenterica DSM 1558]EIW69265.1 hypothetical protein TREMEDRAFT_62122 [Tremella mesenterica DSM 1558]
MDTTTPARMSVEEHDGQSLDNFTQLGDVLSLCVSVFYKGPWNKGSIEISWCVGKPGNGMRDAATSLITAFIETLESDQAMLSTDSTLNRLDEWLQGAHPVFRQTFCTERPETEEAREAWEVVDEALSKDIEAHLQGMSSMVSSVEFLPISHHTFTKEHYFGTKTSFTKHIVTLLGTQPEKFISGVEQLKTPFWDTVTNYVVTPQLLFECVRRVRLR